MVSLRTVVLILILKIVSNVNAQCNRYDPTSCGISNGFQQICVCIPFGGGCYCECPITAEKIEGVCQPRPTKIGQDCWIYNSCVNIKGAAQCPTSEPKKCGCKPDFYPMNDLTSCIPKPWALDELCSDAASCERISGSICTETQCKCLPSLFPNVNNTFCYPAPKIVGDYCSPKNPCSQIPTAVCKEHGENVESTCECPEEYTPSIDRNRCLPTRIGVKCSKGSSCDNLKGARCYGEATEARCICLWSVPNLAMTKCLSL